MELNRGKAVKFTFDEVMMRKYFNGLWPAEEYKRNEMEWNRCWRHQLGNFRVCVLPWKLYSAVVWFDIKNWISSSARSNWVFSTEFFRSNMRRLKQRVWLHRVDVTRKKRWKRRKMNENELQVRSFSVRINKPLLVFLFHIFRYFEGQLP